MMTPDEARALLNNVAKTAPDKLLAASNSIAIAALEQCVEIRATLEKARRVSNQCVAAIKGLQAAGEDPVAAEDAGPGPAAEPPYSPEPRMRADGTPMTAQECAVEDQMDAACAGMPPHPGAAAGPSVGSPAEAPVEESAPVQSRPVQTKKQAKK